MPFESGKDRTGRFVRWGKTGKKYYYDDSAGSYTDACRKADLQRRAIFYSKRNK